MTQGERIKKIRQALDLTQDEFGDIFNIKRQMVSSIEKDNLVLNNDKLLKLLTDYKININYILAGIGDMFIKEQPAGLKEEIKQTVREMLNSGELFKN